MNAPTLSDTIASLATIVLPEEGGFRLGDVDVDLPVEIFWPGGDELAVTPPRWRLRTAFDRDPGRLQVRFGAIEGAT